MHKLILNSPARTIGVSLRSPVLMCRWNLHWKFLVFFAQIVIHDEQILNFSWTLLLDYVSYAWGRLHLSPNISQCPEVTCIPIGELTHKIGTGFGTTEIIIVFEFLLPAASALRSAYEIAVSKQKLNSEDLYIFFDKIIFVSTYLIVYASNCRVSIYSLVIWESIGEEVGFYSRTIHCILENLTAHNWLNIFTKNLKL